MTTAAEVNIHDSKSAVRRTNKQGLERKTSRLRILEVQLECLTFFFFFFSFVFYIPSLFFFFGPVLPILALTLECSGSSKACWEVEFFTFDSISSFLFFSLKEGDECEDFCWNRFLFRRRQGCLRVCFWHCTKKKDKTKTCTCSGKKKKMACCKRKMKKQVTVDIYFHFSVSNLALRFILLWLQKLTALCGGLAMGLRQPAWRGCSQGFRQKARMFRNVSVFVRSSFASTWF